MELLLLGIYSFFAWLVFFKFKWLPWNIVSQVITITLPIIGLTALILTLNVVAPSSADVRVINYVVSVNPQVKGIVTEVPITPNRPVKKGEVLVAFAPGGSGKTYAASAQALGTAVFGGGITVSRSYSNPPSSLSIDIVSDSPLLQSLVMMLNNPMFVGASGGKLEAVKGQRAIVKFNETTRSGDLNIVVDNRFMVTVKGQKIGREDLLAYAGQINFTELAKK